MNPNDDSIITAALRESAQKAGFTDVQANFLVGLYVSLVDLVRLVSKGEPKDKFKTLD